MEGPFFNMATAAEYCGFATATFRNYLKRYKVPKYGPKRTRFAKSDLDKFMVDPEKYAKISPRQQKKYVDHVDKITR